VYWLITVEVSTSGLEFDEVAESLSKDLKQKLVQKLVDIAYAAAFWGAPWRTSKLAGSIVKDVTEGEASISALASYAVYVEKGTAPHEIRPVNASVLVFEVGGVVLTRLVRHPGTKPNPFMQRAVESAREKVEETFAELRLELVEK
jgi:HK97 gp10 family phage protein